MLRACAALLALASVPQTAARFVRHEIPGDARAEFVARAGGANVFFGRSEIVLATLHEDGETSLRIAFEGASADARIEPGSPLPGATHVLRGRSPAVWRVDLPSFDSLRWRGLWPGVDLEAHGRGGPFELDLHLAPGADADRVVLRVDGAGALEIDASGALVARTSRGELRQESAVAWEIAASGESVPVPCRFRILDSTRFGFEVARRDASRPLVIDPVLVFGTYLGGAAADFAYGVAADRAGSAYVAGETWSSDFPRAPSDAKNAFHGGYKDAFVTKLDPNGEKLVYSALIGGESDEVAHGIAVTQANEALVTGFTMSANFPVTPAAADSTLGGTVDAFVVKLNAEGSALAYATFVGGDQDDVAHALATDGAGAAFITGSTVATEKSPFPTTPEAFDKSANGGTDAFVVKLDPTGGRFAYATLIGGKQNDQGRAIAVDAQGAAYVAGSTRSADFPSTDAVQSRPAPASTEAFAIALNASGTSLLHSLCFGGEDEDQANAIAVDSAGGVWVAGATQSKDFPITAGAIDSSWNGGLDAFVVKIPKEWIGFSHASFLGGKARDSAQAIAIDSTGSAIVVGDTYSPDFPRSVGTFDPSWNGLSDVFVAKIPSAGNTLRYSTFLGGVDVDFAFAVALTEQGDAYVAGTTRSSKFPTTPKALSTKHAGGFNDAFVVRLRLP